uniref:PI3K/PI4K catalytic domain-containing protein n=1 Tax=Arcella intermedia TaxID=1963864 RepID=A0A6B2LBZ0_9EUKA
MIDPLFLVKGTVSSVKFVKAYSSHVKPMLLHFNHDNEKDSAYCIYKRGDDLRQDYVVQTMFFLFNRLWKSSPLPDKPFIHQYKILPLGEDSGILEFVHGCQAAGEWQWKILLELPDRDKVNFFKSMAGSYLACWVLGIRDRHQDNMMIKDNKIFFHIDFGFIFNDAPGFDAPIFSIPGDFRRNITQDEWNFFLKLCGDAFAVLHRNSGVIINACTLLMQELPTISVAQVRKYLVKSLMVRKSEKSAKQKIREEISAGIVSTQKELKYLVHGFATKKIWTSTPQN